jgi:hypothetical protein
VVGGLLLAVAALEAWPAGLERLIRSVPPPPPGVQWLAKAPRGPVLELPWHEYHDSAIYLCWSTLHWQPMINGYGSFEPPGNRRLGLIGDRWPTPYAARTFRDFGVRYVVLHTDRLRPPQLARLRSRQDLPEGVRLVEVVAHDWIYEIDPPRPRPQADELSRGMGEALAVAHDLAYSRNAAAERRSNKPD